MTYEENLAKWKKAYTAILKSCQPYADEFYSLYSFRDVRDMRNSAKNHLMLIDWYEKYGLKLSHDYQPYSYNYFKVSDYIIFNHFGDAQQGKDNGRGKYISWSDDDRQPKNEWLLNISFSTGAYIFGQDYDGQQELFQSFIKELKSYKPDYSDTVNKSFYWKLENAKAIFEAFPDIYKKYQQLNTDDFNRRKVEKLKKELAKAEESLK